jgi:hypothetical protein
MEMDRSEVKREKHKILSLIPEGFQGKKRHPPMKSTLAVFFAEIGKIKPQKEIQACLGFFLEKLYISLINRKSCFPNHENVWEFERNQRHERVFFRAGAEIYGIGHSGDDTGLPEASRSQPCSGIS